MFHCLIGIDGVDEQSWNLAIVELKVLEVCCNYNIWAEEVIPFI